jgi:hypothetical protein
LPEGQGTADTGSPAPITMQLPWTPTCVLARKGIVWKPSAQATDFIEIESEPLFHA